MKQIRQCTRCVMDDRSDAFITFDENGYCNYCRDALEQMEYTYFPNEIGKQKLEEILYEIKQKGKGRKYDCIMGISGGLDSSYLAMLGIKWGLRILAVHIDDGFNAPIAVENIRKLCNATQLDLKIITPNSEQFNDLTKAYIKAGVPNLAIPQDNVLFAFLYKLMRKYKITYFLTGGNFALESILQKGNTYTALDVKNIKAINKRFGNTSLNKLSFLSENKRMVNRFMYGIKTLRLLNYIDYNKEKAIQELKEFCDFNYYEAKHLENILTKVVQLYWYYNKFGVDKRTSHLSSLIVSGQLSREHALDELMKPVYNEESMNKDLEFVLDKLDLSREEFENIMKSPNHQHKDYPYTKHTILNFFRKITFFNKLKTKLQ